MQFRYRAIQIKQTSSTKLLAMFSAPAIEIAAWAGVPQKNASELVKRPLDFKERKTPPELRACENFI